MSASATATLKGRVAAAARRQAEWESADADAARARLQPLVEVLDGLVRDRLRAVGNEAAPVLAAVAAEDWTLLAATYQIGDGAVLLAGAAEVRSLLDEGLLQEWLDTVASLTHEGLDSTPEAFMLRRGLDLCFRPLQAREKLQALAFTLTRALDAIAKREPVPVVEVPTFPPPAAEPRRSISPVHNSTMARAWQ